MKRFLLFAVVIIFTERVDAQDASLWVGVSTNSDPMIRRQEAFMNAFCQYISSNNKVSVSGSIIEDWTKTTADDEDSCRFHILSDVTDEESETITISIGRGTLINYMYTSLFEETDDKTRIETVLIVTYREDSESNKTRSQHEYRCLDITYKNGSDKKPTKEFTYKCENVEIYE